VAPPTGVRRESGPPSGGVVITASFTCSDRTASVCLATAATKNNGHCRNSGGLKRASSQIGTHRGDLLWSEWGGRPDDALLRAGHKKQLGLGLAALYTLSKMFVRGWFSGGNEEANTLQLLQGNLDPSATSCCSISTV